MQVLIGTGDFLRAEWDKALGSHATLHLLTGVSLDSPRLGRYCVTQKTVNRFLDNDKSVAC